MTDQPPPESGAAPVPEVPAAAAGDMPPTPPQAAAAADAPAPAPTGWTPPPTPQAPPAPAGWTPPPTPQAPQAPPAPAGAGWTPPPAVPVAGAGWSAYAQAGPSGPAPGWEYAGFWIRVVAYVLDGIILGIVTTVLWLVVLAVAAAIGIGAAASSGVGADGTLTESEVAVIGVGLVAAFTFLGIMTLLVTVLYFVLFWVKRGGTIGQTLLGMRIAREADGAPIGWGTAIVRYVMMLISFWIFYLGVIWVAFEPRKRGWHDIVANTVVVRRV